VLTPEQSLPAPGQGALGIEVRADRLDAAAWVAPLNDATTAACVIAERAFSRALGGSCQIPLGGYAELKNGQVWLRGFVASVDGQQMVEGEAWGTPVEAAALGRQLAEELKAKGAGEILAALACAKH